jgi:hypothetical protein
MTLRMNLNEQLLITAAYLFKEEYDYGFLFVYC